MTATPPRYRTRDRPGPGLATIQEPEGRVRLWSSVRQANKVRTCAQCGALVGWFYRPSLYRGKDTPRLCRACVEGAHEA